MYWPFCSSPAVTFTFFLFARHLARMSCRVTLLVSRSAKSWNMNMSQCLKHFHPLRFFSGHINAIWPQYSLLRLFEIVNYNFFQLTNFLWQKKTGFYIHDHTHTKQHMEGVTDAKGDLSSHLKGHGMRTSHHHIPLDPSIKIGLNIGHYPTLWKWATVNEQTDAKITRGNGHKAS